LASSFNSEVVSSDETGASTTIQRFVPSSASEKIELEFSTTPSTFKSFCILGDVFEMADITSGGT
jgi:hypothetical protein